MQILLYAKQSHLWEFLETQFWTKSQNKMRVMRGPHVFKVHIFQESHNNLTNIPVDMFL